MRLLAFSDLHRDVDRARRLAERAGEADVVIAAGDFASVHMGLGKTIEPLKAVEVPTLLVPGNNETEDKLRSECEDWQAATVLHGERAEIDGVLFFGLGAGVPKTPFPWSFDLSDEDAEELLAPCPDGAVLIMHSPPKGHVDESRGKHLGSEAILRTIERTRPRLTVCGHIHECWGRESTVAGTRVLNLGPEGALLEV